jgi:hypothetical protein
VRTVVDMITIPGNPRKVKRDGARQEAVEDVLRISSCAYKRLRTTQSTNIGFTASIDIV